VSSGSTLSRGQSLRSRAEMQDTVNGQKGALTSLRGDIESLIHEDEQMLPTA